jgi:hypothetical protein
MSRTPTTSKNIFTTEIALPLILRTFKHKYIALKPNVAMRAMRNEEACFFRFYDSSVQIITVKIMAKL